ncbi:MAG: S8 family serine peptidase [Candidatus Eremiobacterota bacterium]
MTITERNRFDFLDGLGANHTRRLTGRMDRDTDDAGIAILDDFTPDAGEEVAHGEKVEQVLMDSGGFDEDDVERYQNTGGVSIEPLLAVGEDEFGGELDAYIEGRFVGLLEATSDNLEEILQDHDIRVINQSQSVSEARVTARLWAQAQDDPEFRRQLERELGLASPAEDADLLQALVDRVDHVVEGSQRVQEAQQRYDGLTAELDERGVVYVVTAGNLGSFAREMERLGVEGDADFFHSAFDNGHTTVVGASDGEEGPADFTSPDAGAELAIDGEDVPISVNGHEFASDGTSFAAPQVAALAARMLEVNPDLTDEEVERMMESSADPGDSDTLGAGVVNPEVALLLAYLSGRRAA